MPNDEGHLGNTILGIYDIQSGLLQGRTCDRFIKDIHGEHI